MQIRWLVLLTAFVMINLNNRIGSGGTFVRRVDLTMGERKTKTVSASVKGFMFSLGIRPAQLEIRDTAHSSVSSDRQTLVISRLFIERSVCPRTYGGKKQIMMMVSPSLPRHVENSMCGGAKLFLPGDIYMSRGGSLVTAKSGPLSALVCLLCCNEAIAESVGRSELLASPP